MTDPSMTEADTCRTYVVPRLQSAGWDAPPHSIAEQRTFTDGRIVVSGRTTLRKKQKRADYLLRHRRDFTIAVVEAKAAYKLPADGMQQAKEYAEMLGLTFAYSTNGHGIIEFDYLTGIEGERDAFPTPDDLWQRLCAAQSIDTDAGEKLLTPMEWGPGRTPRYYQEIAINRSVQAILQGKRRILLLMATGTGKSLTAFQICWKLWHARWNLKGEPHRRPRILYLADLTVLVDDPKDKTFQPFGDARWKISGGVANKSREIYFATYQAIARDERRPGLYREYPRDFFDLVIVDEAHRGSARAESNWREILEYFAPAVQLGMTATPKRDENVDTYEYFGNPLYTYSLRQGIDDGFLAPYRVHRVISQWDAAGWRPSKDDLDRYGRMIPDEEYGTKDFERIVALRARTDAIARHLADFMARTDRFAKTIVFCVDQEHADEMRRALTNLNSDLVKQHPDYAARVTADEGEIGRGHLARFQEPDDTTPVILTTSKLLTTGVDAPTCKNIVLARVVTSMTEFKQIIGRGTRVRDDYGKLYFNIIDYTGSATRLFADPEFDGDPALVIEETINQQGERVAGSETIIEPEEPVGDDAGMDVGMADPADPTDPRKFYFDNGQVEIVSHLVYELDPDGKQLRVVKFTDYTAEKVRILYPSAAKLREEWADAARRAEIIAELGERGIDLDRLREITLQPDADPFDLLCHLAYSAPLRTRRERSDRVKRDEAEFFAQYGPEARQILNDLLDKYAEHGVAQFDLPGILRVPPLSERGSVRDITRYFNGPEQMREALATLQSLLYAA